MAWYQRTYFLKIKFLQKKIIKSLSFKNLFFIIIINIYLNFLYPCSHVYCINYLNSHIVGGNIAYCYKHIDKLLIHDFIYNIKYSNIDDLSYLIYKYYDVNGKPFPINHPLSHPHLNILGFNNFNSNYYVNLQFSTKNFDSCSLLTNETLLFEDRPQFITTSFYFYEKKLLFKELYQPKSTFNYLNINRQKIDTHMKLVRDLYKI